MSTNFKKRDKLATQRDSIRGQQAMDRLTGVVRYEQRMQAKSGQLAATFNSQPQAGWKKEWKSTMAGKDRAKVDASTGPDAAWTDEQGWLQGSRKCFDSRRPAPATKEAGYPSGASVSTILGDCAKTDRIASARESASALPSLPVLPEQVPRASFQNYVAEVNAQGQQTARESASALPSLPVLPEQVSRTSFQNYVAEVNAQVQQTLFDPSIRVETDGLHRYTAELAQALRVLSKPASALQKTQICEAMASVWDMRSNSAPLTGAPLDLSALSVALENLRRSFCLEEVLQCSRDDQS